MIVLSGFNLSLSQKIFTQGVADFGRVLFRHTKFSRLPLNFHLIFVIFLRIWKYDDQKISCKKIFYKCFTQLYGLSHLIFSHLNHFEQYIVSIESEVIIVPCLMYPGWLTVNTVNNQNAHSTCLPNGTEKLMKTNYPSFVKFPVFTYNLHHKM